MQFFRPEEFRCNCGKCQLGFPDMKHTFLLRLDDARRIAGIPFTVTSSIRCPEWNAKVGGVDSSAHLAGWAADIAATAGPARWKIAMAAQRAGFNRLGIAHTFIHMDCDPNKPSHVIWTY